MGACKSALEASKIFGKRSWSKKIRVNAISAGPKNLAASAIGDAKFLYKWNEDHSFLKKNVATMLKFCFVPATILPLVLLVKFTMLMLDIIK